jgi:small neutral amino acid transporter SnatA (MarC family)
MGPLRTIAVFYELTLPNDWPYRVRAAVFGTLIAGAIIAVVALVGVSTIESWHVSVAALEMPRDIANSLDLLHAVHTRSQREENG